MEPVPILQAAVLALLTLVAAALDVHSRRIPNWLTATGLVAGLAVQFFLSGAVGLRTAALGFGLAVLIYIPLFALRAMGGGDVKLMAALGALLGPERWFAVFLLTAILGGILALAVVFTKGRVAQTVSNLGSLVGSLARGKAPHEARAELDVANPKAATLPHGLSIALGSLAYLTLAGLVR
ncbi:MAG: A24 family peptidase [Bryobacter sp.]|jgi:prepilin peptidase CpaA|nr:A24 family peptidase [Bryobacter sp.]